MQNGFGEHDNISCPVHTSVVLLFDKFSNCGGIITNNNNIIICVYVYIGIQYYPINHHVYYCYVPMGILYVIILLLLSYVIKTTNHNLIRLIKENAQENRATTLFHLDDHQCYISRYYDDHKSSSNSSQLVRPVGCASRIKAIVVHIALHFCFYEISPPPLLLMLRPTSAILTRLQ